MTRWKKAVGVVAAVMVVVSLTACSGSTRTKGGDTTCGEYLTMSSDDQYQFREALLCDGGRRSVQDSRDQRIGGAPSHSFTLMCGRVNVAVGATHWVAPTYVVPRALATC